MTITAKIGRIGFTERGAWVDTIDNYMMNDLVHHNNGIWRCIIEGTRREPSNITPDWVLWVQGLSNTNAPSDNYITYPFTPADGPIILTVPADGWVYVNMTLVSGGQIIAGIYKQGTTDPVNQPENSILAQRSTYTNGWNSTVIVPARKSQVLLVQWSGSVMGNSFQLVYASKSV